MLHHRTVHPADERRIAEKICVHLQDVSVSTVCKYRCASVRRTIQGGLFSMKKWTRALYQPNLPLYGSTRVTCSPEHIAISKKAAREGMVLLKNENHVLPLAAGSHIALFGKGTFDYVKGGGGSGDVTVPYIKNLYDGFLEHPDLVCVDQRTADYYRKYVDQQYAEGGVPGMIAEPELPDDLVRTAASTCDTAIISISRFSGEGWDRKSEFGSPEPGPNDDAVLIGILNRLFQHSDFYLSDAEKAMVQKVTAAFHRVVVVMNVGGMVATDWCADDPAISSVLMAWQGGMEGGPAAAELLLGLDTPSGKLSDTFAARLEDYPSSEGFHESTTHVDYTEDIYVGYRYFETIPGAREKVVYPFGYGLSYTTFSLTGAEGKLISDSDSTGKISDACVRVSVLVTNTGSSAGREVVQLYFSAPQGLLGKPARQLCAYHKTRKLQPGESELVTLTVPVKSLASYDDLGHVQKSAWVLEKGTYRFYLGTNVRSASPIDDFLTLDENVIAEQLTSRMAPTQLSRRLLADGSYENLPQGTPNDPNENRLESLPRELIDGCEPETRSLPHSFTSWAPGAKHDLPQLIDVAEGRMTLDDFIDRLPDTTLASLIGGQPNRGVSNTYAYGDQQEYGIPGITTADGPAGLRLLPEVEVKTTAFPCSTLLSCTWDPEITYEVGRAGGEEVKENNIGAWLTPAVNIHRSPLCGRNFEYYSEDPFLAGKQASGMVRGIQSNHIAATVKHFALNNKETNRKNSDSRASERAIREIYLKQFEIIVKEAHPWSIMSSYNIINGHRASEDSDLLIGILRGEWGWDGMVTTDWWTYGEQYKEAAAGNDMKMGTGYADRIMTALEKGYITRDVLETAARHILTLILRID